MAVDDKLPNNADGAPLSVLYSFPHEIGAPGIGTTAWQQVAGLANHGMRVTLFCTSVRIPLPDTVRVVETLRAGSTRIPHRALGVARAYRYHDARTAWWLRRTRTPFNVVHCWPSASLYTARVADQRSVPSLRELPNAHTAETFAATAKASQDTDVALPAMYSHHPSDRRLRLEEREFSAADFLLAPSDFVLNSFVRTGTSTTRIIRHTYGFDPATFAPETPDPRRPFRALFVGRGEPAKGLHFALLAWQRAQLPRSARFVIAGRMLPAYEKYLADRLADPSVEVVGFIEDVGRLMREADILLFPTYTEGSALVTYEAMASGVVPLVSNAAGAPLTHDVSGLVHDTGDVATLTDQLRTIHDDPTLRARLRNGSLEASRTLTWDAAAARLISGYRLAMERHHRYA